MRECCTQIAKPATGREGTRSIGAGVLEARYERGQRRGSRAERDRSPAERRDSVKVP